MTNESDEALYARLLAGELAAFDVLYARFERPLFGFVRAQLHDAAEAEDVFHEAFLAVLHARRTGTELRSFKAWLFQVARHACLNRIRTRQRARVFARSDRALESVAQTETEAPADPVADPKQLQAAVGRLPPVLADVYRLRAAGLSYDEVASTLDIPVGTVKSRMHEMIKRLREEMS